MGFSVIISYQLIFAGGIAMVIGVGFLLFSITNHVPRLFVVKELRDKPTIHKQAGMLSFPLETNKTSDGGYAGTICRLFKEEIGISPDQVEIKKIINEEFRLIPGRSDIITVYGYGLYKGNMSSEVFLPSDNDIAFHGWLSCGELLAQPLIRVEVAPIIHHFIRSEAILP
jgi:hypothetical protein